MMIDTIIIGAGIVGSACAHALTQRGQRVLVLDSAAHAGTRGATVAGMGHLVVMDDNPAELALTAWSCRLWRELVASDPQRHEFHQCGTLWVAQDEEEMDAARAKQATLAQHGVHSEIVDQTSLAQLEPELVRGLPGGLLVTGDAITYAPKSAHYLMQQAFNTGRAQYQQGQVIAVNEKGVQLADGTLLQTDAILVANGMGAHALLPELPLRAKKGHIAITDRYPGFVRHQLVELGYIKSAHASDGDSVAFNIQPRTSGQMMIGSSRQYDRADTAIDQAILRKMLARSSVFLPNLPALNSIRCWTGVRCASPDGLPLLGAHPQRAKIWLAVGHEGLGVTTALASAQILAAQITNSAAALPIDATPYLPHRFPSLLA